MMFSILPPYKKHLLSLISHTPKNWYFKLSPRRMLS